MPYDKLPPLSDDLDLNNFDTLVTSSKRTQNLGPLWFIPPRYKPTRSNTRLDVISIRQSRYRDRRLWAVQDQGNSSGEDSDDTAMDTTPDVYGDPRYMLSSNTAPATPYTPRAFSAPLYPQHQVRSMGSPFPSSSLGPASHRMLPPYAYEQPKLGRHQY